VESLRHDLREHHPHHRAAREAQPDRVRAENSIGVIAVPRRWLVIRCAAADAWRAATCPGVVRSRNQRGRRYPFAGLARVLGVPAPARAGCASAALGALKGARDSCAAPPIACLAAPGRSPAAATGRPAVAGCARPLAAAAGVVDAFCLSSDGVALASRAGRAPLDLLAPCRRSPENGQRHLRIRAAARA
jgi:hypothetical protein